MFFNSENHHSRTSQVYKLKKLIPPIILDSLKSIYTSKKSPFTNKLDFYPSFIIDAFVFFDELDLLESRLAYLYDYVDLFLIVESNKTFTGKSKDYYYEKNEERFSRFKHKVVYLKHSAEDVNKLSSSYVQQQDAWTYEYSQRELISDNLHKFPQDSCIMINDVDEFPSRDFILYMKDNTSAKWRFSRIEMDNYYYFANCKCYGRHAKWIAPFYSRADLLMNSDLLLNHLRSLSFSMPIQKNSGWHFSYLGGYQKIKSKLDSFAHQELNIEKFNNSQSIIDKIKAGQDLFERDNYEYGYISSKHLPDELRCLLNKHPYFFADINFPFDM